MSQSIYDDAILRIAEQEEKINFATSNIIHDSYRMTSFLRELLSEVKQYVLSHGFLTKVEEVEFFRKIKPQILGKLIYYNKVYRIEISCPITLGKFKYKYYNGELNRLKKEYETEISNTDFYKYYRSGRTDLDHIYFELGKINFNDALSSYVFEIDTQFSTYYDYKVARIISSDLMLSYLTLRISPHAVEINDDKDLCWTDSKNSLIELIYALHSSRSISGGRVGIRKLALVLQDLFKVELLDIHHAFHRMKVRSGSKTAYLDKLKISLEDYMEKDIS